MELTMKLRRPNCYFGDSDSEQTIMVNERGEDQTGIKVRAVS